MRLQTSIPLAKANAIIEDALARGRKASLLPLTVVVLDAGGKLVAMQCEDGSGLVRFEIAFGKAYGALGMGISSRLIRDRLSERPAFQGAIAAASGGQFIPVPGGVLIENADGITLGAVGVSGDTSDKDEYCAIEAIKSAGFASEPADPNPEWRTSSLSDHYKAST
ncbi:MAG: GlcG/HbpS family heme-binding protein [Yoonia sp.]|uniref:GlcG/HbpS family heme-binding protein n=1 Tax=Yoonia sp. TaxID=2212373 RepID=UPI003EF25A25